MPALRATATRVARSTWLPRVELIAVLAAVVVLTAGVVTASAAAVLAGALIGFAGEAAFALTGRRVEDILARAHLATSTRMLILQGLLLAGAIEILQPVGVPVVLIGLAAVLAPAVGQVAYAYPTNFSLHRQRALIWWHNLPAHRSGPAGPAPLRTVLPVLGGGPALRDDTTASAATMGYAGLVLVAGTAVGIATSSTAPLAVAGVLVVVVVAAVVVAATLQWRRVRSRVRPAAANADVVTALTELAPTVVVYFSSPPSGGYALKLWLGVIEQFRQPTLIVLREPEHLDQIPATGIPIVVADSATDVESVAVDSVRVALYPTNVVKNNHLLRVPGVRHCFIGHGDSDKAGSYSPVSRVYDEIWVAGPAGAERYAAVGEGVRPDQIVQVGRPTLAHVHRAAPIDDRSGPRTVLYAPTWEGFYAESDYSSLLTMGERIVDGLLAAGTRVVFKPHPATGEREVRARAVADAIARRLRNAGSGHRVIAADGPPVDEVFDAVDLLVTDVSSVITDFLAAAKPYVVTNPRGLSPAAFATAFPASDGGYLLDPGCLDLPSLIASANGPDPLGPRRRALAEYLLGPVTDDPVGRFVDEVDACVRRCDDDRAARAVRAPSDGRTERLAT